MTNQTASAMKNPAFLQIHTLTSYPVALLNRDDAGFAKRVIFGGVPRIRVSSQCQKRHWRVYNGMYSLAELNVPRSVRSRETFKLQIAQPLIEEGYPLPLVVAFAYYLLQLLTTGKPPGESELKKILEAEGDEELLELLRTSQMIVLGVPEVDYLKQLIKERLEALRLTWERGFTPSDDNLDRILQQIQTLGTGELKKNIQGLYLASGLDAALFGRMVTSDILARADGAIHVAHAFTTHAEETESDYFTAVDELVSEEKSGSGLVSSQELTSGLYYSYVVVNVPLLVSNLEGVDPALWEQADRTLAAEVVSRLLYLIAMVSPGAKLGSTAPYSYAQCMLLEWGKAQPRTLANAFQRPVSFDGEGVLINSYRALGHYVEQMDRMYGRLTERRVAGIDLPEDVLRQLQVDRICTLDELATWASEKIRGEK